jgi:AcrR family transcriptional regulator
MFRVKEFFMPEALPDRRRVRGDATRARVLRLAADMASEEGLEGLTLSRLAQDLGISRSNVHALFGGSKQELQLATVAAARARFVEAVVQPVIGRPPGLERLRGLLDSWCDYIAADVFIGGCFVLHGLFEYGRRPGPVRDALIAAQREWMALLRRHLQIAIDNGELEVADPEQLMFELDAALVGANTVRLAGDPQGPERGRIAVSRALERHRPVRSREQSPT